MVVDEATFGHRQCVRPAFTLDASATIAARGPRESSSITSCWTAQDDQGDLAYQCLAGWIHNRIRHSRR